MIQLKILSGKMAGAVVAARRFPFQVGRAADSDLQMEEPGVWDKHLSIDFQPREGFVLAAQPEAGSSVNGAPVQSVLLRNGDLIEIGSIKIRFWLGEVEQRSLNRREMFVWVLIALISLGQIALIYWMSV